MNGNQNHQIEIVDTIVTTGCVDTYSFSPATAPLSSISLTGLAVKDTDTNDSAYSYIVAVMNSINSKSTTLNFTITISSKSLTHS